VTLRHARNLFKICSGLIQSPAFGVDAGVDHEPYGTEQTESETLQVRQRIAVVESHFPSQDFGIQGPPLRVGLEIVILQVGVDTVEPLIAGKVQLLGQGELCVVSGIVS